MTHTKGIRRRIFEIIEKGEEDDIPSRIYDYYMMIAIVASIVPMCFKTQPPIFAVIEKVTVCAFIVDYALRLITADFINEKHRAASFFVYPLRPMAIVDLLSILPSLTNINPAFRALKVLRIFRTLRVFKFFRYSKNVQIISNVIKRKRDALLTVSALAVAYIFVMALIVFQAEPQTFENFFQAFYWATVSLTTVGYGDIYPVSNIGRFISMISSFVGIAVVALPSGIIITGYQEELMEAKENGHD